MQNVKICIALTAFIMRYHKKVIGIWYLLAELHWKYISYITKYLNQSEIVYLINCIFLLSCNINLNFKFCIYLGCITRLNVNIFLCFSTNNLFL